MRIKLFLFFTVFLYGHSLTDIVNSTFEKNFKLKSFDSQIKANNYKIKQSTDNYLPSVSIDASAAKDKYYYQYPSERVKYNSLITSYSLKVSQVVYNAKISALIQDSKLKSKYTAFQKQDYKQQLLNKIVQTYIDALMYKSMLNIYYQKLTNYQTMKNEIAKKLKYGFSTKNDYLNIESEIIKTQKNIIQSKLRYESDLNKLKIYTHFQDVAVNGKIDVCNFDENLKGTFVNNPAYKLYELNVKIAKNEINKRKAAFYPNANLNASYTNTHSDDSITKKDEYLLSLNINIPLFNKQNNDYYNEAKELYNSSYYDYLDYKNNLKLNLSETISQIKILKRSIMHDLQEVKIRNSLVKNAGISYNNKLIKLSSYLSVANDYYDSKIALLKDSGVLLNQYVNYLYYTGNLTLNQIKKIQNKYIKEQ